MLLSSLTLPLNASVLSSDVDLAADGLYRGGPINSWYLAPSHLINYSRKPGKMYVFCFFCFFNFKLFTVPGLHFHGQGVTRPNLIIHASSQIHGQTESTMNVIHGEHWGRNLNEKIVHRLLWSGKGDEVRCKIGDVM
jgi:hypothetical protein